MSGALQRFSPITSVGRSGELVVNAGSYSRASIIAAFEMTGGLERFADWAADNPTDFYTKLFGKLLGREVASESNKKDDVEDLLDVLDLEAEDITDETEPTPNSVSKFRSRLAEKAALYVEGEVEAD